MELEIPGDKSITHRAFLFAALAEGESLIRRPLRSEDTTATLSAIRSLGVDVSELGDSDAVRVKGVGLRGFRQPTGAIDCGNSGTTARLLMGALAGQPVIASLTGDASLRARPMGRVATPLTKMGATVRWEAQPDRLPLTVVGGSLKPIDYPLPVASAQVKSALLLAGLTGRAFVLLTEPARSRDHSERLLATMGAPTLCHRSDGGWRVELRDPPEVLRPLDLVVPGDPSTAAFLAVWAVLSDGTSPLRLKEVTLNPTRTGYLSVLTRMGARIDVESMVEDFEPVGDLIVHPSELRSTTIEGSEIPSLLDEVPLLAVAAARAEGVTRIRGAAELRVKESDRLAALAAGLSAIGVSVHEYPDGLDIEGTDRPLTGRVATFGDHRIEMAFGVLGASPGANIDLDGVSTAAVSFPDFWTVLDRLSRWRADGGEPRPGGRPLGPPEARRPIVTIDGPAGSGKSTTARAVAERLGLRHLDSGALYRAITLAALRSGVRPDEVASLAPEAWRAFEIDVKSGDHGVEVRIGRTPVAQEELRSPEVTRLVSVVAALPAVRECLLRLQRQAGSEGGLVADGRDMGTVVFPDAEVKVFLTADLEERAKRRLRETGSDPDDPDRVTGAAGELQRRDFRDAHREHAPLRRPKGAVVIDTTACTLEEQIGQVIELVRAAESDG